MSANMDIIQKVHNMVKRQLRINQEQPTRKYVSMFSINGAPILPPLMTVQRYLEMQRYKKLAVNIERRLRQRGGENTELEKDIKLQKATTKENKPNTTISKNSCNKFDRLGKNLVDVSTNTEQFETLAAEGRRQQHLGRSDTLIYDNKANAIIKFFYMPNCSEPTHQEKHSVNLMHEEYFMPPQHAVLHKVHKQFGVSKSIWIKQVQKDRSKLKTQNTSALCSSGYENSDDEEDLQPEEKKSILMLMSATRELQQQLAESKPSLECTPTSSQARPVAGIDFPKPADCGRSISAKSNILHPMLWRRLVPHKAKKLHYQRYSPRAEDGVVRSGTSLPQFNTATAIHLPANGTVGTLAATPRAQHSSSTHLASNKIEVKQRLAPVKMATVKIPMPISSSKQSSQQAHPEASQMQQLTRSMQSSKVGSSPTLFPATTMAQRSHESRQAKGQVTHSAAENVKRRLGYDPHASLKRSNAFYKKEGAHRTSQAQANNAGHFQPAHTKVSNNIYLENTYLSPNSLSNTMSEAHSEQTSSSRLKKKCKTNNLNKHNRGSRYSKPQQPQNVYLGEEIGDIKSDNNIYAVQSSSPRSKQTSSARHKQQPQKKADGVASNIAAATAEALARLSTESVLSLKLLSGKRQLINEMEQQQRQRFQELVASQAEEQKRLQDEFSMQQQLLLDQLFDDMSVYSKTVALDEPEPQLLLPIPSELQLSEPLASSDSLTQPNGPNENENEDVENKVGEQEAVAANTA